MRHQRKIFFLCVLVVIFDQSFAQCPLVDFNLPATVCRNQNVVLDNTSGAGSYQWDFCTGELNSTPQARTLVTLPGVNGLPAIEFAKDGNRWFGFATGTNSNVLYRMEFQNGINQTPTFTENLGSLSGKLNGPRQIRIIKENNLWYGFVLNNSGNEILKLEFGDKLSNAFTTTVLASGIGGVNIGLALGKDPVHGWVCVVSSLALNNFSIVRIGNALGSPLPADIITSTSVPNPNNLGDVDLINVCGSWIGFADNLGNGNVYRLDFGTNLFSSPVITQILTIPAAVNPGRLRMVKDGEEYFLLVVDLGGTLTKLKFGTDPLSIPNVAAEGNVGGVLPANIYGIGVAKDNSTWAVQVVNSSDGTIYQVDYIDNCSASPKTSNDTNPTVSYSNSGNYAITLETENATGIQAKSHPVVVSSNVSPDINFTTQNICANHDVFFTSQNVSGNIADYDWSFGDAATSTSQNPSHQYSSAGVYDVALVVTATITGCENFIKKSVSIYNQPVADFATPAVNPFCTNQNYVLDNTSIFDAGYVPTWQWKVNGSIITSNEDLSYTFLNTSNHEIRLKASIPGCETEMIKNINTLVDGPVTDFTFSGQCEDDVVTFTNTSTGDSYSWDFDDGQNPSTTTNPTHIFSNIGSYDVTLTASNTITGCNNTKTKSVSVYSKPQTNFLLSAPPFSCNGTPSQFNDLTPAPPDSNINGWSWNFGDAGSSQNTSTLKNPLHTYATAGDYTVSITVTTNFLCSSTLQSPVTISQTPTVTFTSAPTCEDVPVLFSGGSTATITAWNWTIGTTDYIVQKPTHTFNNPGNSSATLSATATNGCIGTLNKPITIPIKLTPDFSVAKNCVNQQTTFTDITNATADPLASQAWSFGTLGTGTGSPVNFSFATTGSVSVVLTNTTQTGCMYTLTKAVNIIASPQASFAASPSTGAAPLNVQFTNTSVNATSYLWTFHDQNNSTSTVASPTFTYNALGDYQPELTAFNAQNCSHTNSRTVSVMVPVTNVALGGLELIEFQNGLKPAVTIFNRGNGPLTNLPLLLNISGEIIRERVSATINPNTSYRYVFSFEFPTSNSADFFCVEAEIDDITPNDNEVCLNVEQLFITFPPYPNPSKGSFHIDWIAHEAGIVNLTIINSMGQEQQNLGVESVEGLNPITITTDGLAAGIYLVKIKYLGLTKVYRVLVSE